MTQHQVLDWGVIVAALGVALTWAGASMIRRPADAARGLRAWSTRRWLREEDAPRYLRDPEHGAWSARVIGRWWLVFGVLMLALGARMIVAAL
jgi:hypothetical protein